MPERTPSPARLVIALMLLVAVHPGAPAWAWGRLGHRVISRIAEKNLTAKAKAGIAGLLEPGESLADASLWADENRGRLPKTAPWHYVDVPLDEPRYDARFSGDTSSKGCVVDRINEFKRIVGDPGKSAQDRRFALRFLIHCVEDLHQPCHVGDNHDKGGNQTQVRWFERGSNMHRVWDTGIIERAGTTEAFWLNDLAGLDTPENRAAWMAGTPEDWATESLLAAREAYQNPQTGKRIRPGAKLGDAYLAKNLPVARQRLARAGMRLAMLLNEAFRSEQP
jgi:nuclease S1